MGQLIGKTLRFHAAAALFALASLSIYASTPKGASAVVNSDGLGVIKGMVRDEAGSPIADASVAIFRAGSTILLKQVASARDGSFLARILPGRYTVLAVAEGFNPISIKGVEVGRAAELSYGFNLERAGSGNTLPEKRRDRNSSKWRILAAQADRSIYQHNGSVTRIPADESLAAEQDPPDTKRNGQTAVETYFAAGDRGNFAGLNFATIIPVGNTADIVFAGQAGVGRGSPQRIEVGTKFTPIAGHSVRLTSNAAKFSHARSAAPGTLGQISIQGTDEWAVGRGIVFVYGLDYSRFIGLSDASSLSPRLGLQFDLSSKTRVRSSFTTQTEDRSWAHSLDLEGESVAFAEPVAIEDLVVVNKKPQMNRSSRLEFGIERVLDNRSSVEANVFFDISAAHGVGLNALGFDTLGEGTFSEFVADQKGRAQGMRVVYTRRLAGPLTASGGYSFGIGQRLSTRGIIDPAHVFESDIFQSFFAQVAAHMKSGTTIRAIYRLSPEATVFAIDPFKGSLAIYDPGLSVLVSQSLPSLGLPIRAQAVVDARNIFGFQTSLSTEEGVLRFAGQGPVVRGGIKVQF